MGEPHQLCVFVWELPAKKKAKRKKKKIQSFTDESPDKTVSVEAALQPVAPLMDGVSAEAPSGSTKPNPKPNAKIKPALKLDDKSAVVNSRQPKLSGEAQFQSPQLEPEVSQLIAQIPEPPEELHGSTSWYDQIEEEEEEALAAAAAAAAVPKPKAWAKTSPVDIAPSGAAEKGTENLNWQQRELMNKSTTNAQRNKQSRQSDWQSTRHDKSVNGSTTSPTKELPADASKCLWVGGVSLKANEHDLKDMFSELDGEVIKVKLLKEKKCAFVTMDSKESATEVLQQLNDKTLIDRRLVIHFAKDLNELSNHSSVKKAREPRQPRTAQSAETVATPHLVVEATGLTKEALLALLPAGSVIGLAPKPKSPGSWFADFASVRAALQAKKTLESKAVNGVAISASYSKGRPSKQLWVGNLSPSVTSEVLTEAFAAHGTVQSVDLLGNSHCAFVWMASAAAASKAADALHGTFMGSGHVEYKGQSGLPIKVNFADKGGKGPSPGKQSHAKAKVDEGELATPGSEASVDATSSAEAAVSKSQPEAAKNSEDHSDTTVRPKGEVREAKPSQGKKIKVERKKPSASAYESITAESNAAAPETSESKDDASKGSTKPDGKKIKVERKETSVEISGASKQDEPASAADKVKLERKKIKVERRKEPAAKGAKQADTKPKTVAPSADIPLPKPKPAISSPK